MVAVTDRSRTVSDWFSQRHIDPERGGAIVVFRKQGGVDAFQRQISQLRHQLGNKPEDNEGDLDAVEADDEGYVVGSNYQQQQRGPQGNTHITAPDAPVTTDRSPYRPYDEPESEPYFAPKQELEEPVMAAPSFMNDPATSIISPEATWRGDLQTNGTVHVQGRVEGSITAREDIFIAEDADVDATVVANAIVIAGNVKGSVRAQSRLEILPEGRISGEIIAPTLIIHEGAHVTSTVRMTLTEDERASGNGKTPAIVQRRAAKTGSGRG